MSNEIYEPKHSDRAAEAIQRGNFKHYLTSSHERLLERLAYILGELQQVTEDIACVEAAATFQRTNTFYQSREKSVQARDREASYYAQQFTNELTELRALRDIYLIEKEFILLLLNRTTDDNSST